MSKLIRDLFDGDEVYFDGLTFADGPHRGIIVGQVFERVPVWYIIQIIERGPGFPTTIKSSFTGLPRSSIWHVKP